MMRSLSRVSRVRSLALPTPAVSSIVSISRTVRYNGSSTAVATAVAATPAASLPVWRQAMPDEQFKTMRDILAAPSPVGLEAAMTRGTHSTTTADALRMNEK